MMRVCQVISHYVPAYRFGGPLRVAHSLGRALTAAGHEVRVCTTNLADERHNLQVPVSQPVMVDGVTVFYEPTAISRYWGFSPGLLSRAKQNIAWADVVFVHFHYQFANWVGATTARRLGKPYILFAHGSFNRWAIQGQSTWKKQAYLRLVEKRNIEGALFVAFNSLEEQDLSLFRERGQLIPSGVDPSEFFAAPPRGSWRAQNPQLAGKTCYLYLGRLNPGQKGLDLLIPAFARLAQRREDGHLVLAGPDERGGEAIVRDMVKQLGIDGQVTFTGMIQGAEKLAVLRDCDAFVLASPSEGTSIALLEAMYLGLPVVVTRRVGLARRIQQESCGLVVDRDVDQLAAALERMTSPEDRREMGERARELVKANFTWDVIVEDLVDQLQEQIG